MTELAGRTHELTIRVYWEDTDAGGIVYHANYLNFMERGRTELLRDLGLGQGGLQAREGMTFVVRRMDIVFDRPAVLDDLLTVETFVAEIGGASMTLSQRVLRDGAVLASASVIIVAIAEGKPRRIPPEVRKLFLRDG
ncbi:tol-pal system-associated acyl-CoA thioesterase [Agaricicola taiwanensis]|uniref:Tol-pal system-associated acyl-CoA thioesterase n=1 Tax=Agaricicola taiwanensis TaxID=591372 RepID=A0A8J2VS85_9RHOB|nr:tol-pal system-associated acyl-CoA thioesterase [Agaricicola taiwanensis]GGE39044.1 tol-pal system-associated acyl-CoA thioesterase [Agaricicola taiwanensis]